MASESSETANQLMKSQSSDEASQLFNNSLASKAVTRPSDNDNNNDSFENNILRSAIIEEVNETVKNTIDTTDTTLEEGSSIDSIKFRNDVKSMIDSMNLDYEVYNKKSLGELKAEEALIEKRLNEMF